MSHNFNDAVISSLYEGTDVPIKKGDRIILDGIRKGTIIEILSPNTDIAQSYFCNATGGLLVQMDDFGLTVEPFGFYGVVEKLEEVK